MKPEKRFAVVIHPDTTIEIVETAGGVDEIHRLVGGHFENVYSTNFHVFPIVVSVNDIGKLIGLAFNPLGTLLHNNPYDFLVGHVVILKLERVGEFDELDQLPMTKFEANILKAHLILLNKKAEKAKNNF